MAEAFAAAQARLAQRRADEAHHAQQVRAALALDQLRRAEEAKREQAAIINMMDEAERRVTEQTARLQAQLRAEHDERERRAAEETKRLQQAVARPPEPDGRATLEHRLRAGIWRLSARDTTFDPALKKALPPFITGMPKLVPAIAASAGLAAEDIPFDADVNVRFAHLVEALRCKDYTLSNLADVLEAQGHAALADRLRSACQQ